MKLGRSIAASAVLLTLGAGQVWAQESLPAELYQLLQDAKWLKEQGKLEEAREKLAEYDQRVRAWRELEKQREELGDDWLQKLVQWAAEVDISEGLDTAEREFGEGKLVVATFRLLSLRERITGGIHLGRARCLYGRLMLADNDQEALRERAEKLGGPCALGSVIWPGGGVGRSASESGPSVEATIETQVTESNAIWQRWSWQAELRNASSVAQAFTLEIQWVDAAGFVVESDRQYGLRLAPGEERRVSDYQLIRQPGAGSVVGAQVVVRTGR
jgi:hypothetical protein